RRRPAPGAGAQRRAEAAGLRSPRRAQLGGALVSARRRRSRSDPLLLPRAAPARSTVATDLIQLGNPALREKARLSLTVNGEPRELLVDGYKTLLELLREDLQLTGTKHGCELGECGACAVLLDGQLVLSCLVAAVECEARAVETVEGMQAGPELHPLQAC